MKTSELINRLIALKKKHGDLEVLAGDPDFGMGLYPVTQAEEDQGTIDLYHEEGPYCRTCKRGCS